ncbi:WD40 repeat domain-containing protein [Streptomyces cinnabarinus]|uniref:WD40 repeat domain-containing protein n=1 Tax=Streptomyces cinnabarinus TaxID=67287 RepID=A0ABY7KCN9_9ACTN|nr:WD40 repeat domain-containing protein [Streptomyces cinnabarinus]WAZ20917.1 WD40 repeat domain-containing protein [Streptomyces cinnabarinus]
MNVEELVRDALRETAEAQAPAAPGLADRVLAVRRRRRSRRIAAAAVGTVAVVALAVGVPQLDFGKDDIRPAGLLDGGSRTYAHPDQSPPRELIAAGQVALAAYCTTETRAEGDHGRLVRTYWLLDPATGRYEKDPRWSYVAVAPGMRTAAVLERTLPTRRIGLLDLATGEVERWIPVGHGVGGLAYSRDGTRLVATTYEKDPDLMPERGTDDEGEPLYFPGPERSTRTGFIVLDPTAPDEAGNAWSSAPDDQRFNTRADFAFSRDGRLVYAQFIGERDGLQQFYDLAGNKVAVPANERHLRWDVGARLSPDGTLAAHGLTKEVRDKAYSSIRDPRTGKEITKVRGGELIAWVDDRRLIAWERSPGEEAYRPRLALVTIGSDKVTWLSGAREQRADTRWTWEPVFARR